MTTEMSNSETAEEWLEQFSAKYANRQRIHDIPSGDREQWGALNNDTHGLYISRFMTIDVWGTTPGTLTTAATLIRRYVPHLMQNDEAVRRTVVALEDAARRQKTQNRAASPGKIFDPSKK